MSEDLDFDDLKKAMHAATPAPDAVRRAENIALAEKNFDRLQGSRPDARPTSDARETGLFRGVIAMLKSIPAKGALAASTALVAVGLVFVLPALQDGPAPLPRTFETAVPEGQNAPVADMMAEPLVEPSIAVAPMAKATGRAIAPEIMPIPRDTETYPEADPNPLKVTAETPVSTFSIDVDTASYGIIRNSIETGTLPPRDAVRIEEMLNYFPYAYDGPKGDAPFAAHLASMVTPWNPETRLLRIAIQGRLPDITERPPLNLVFLIDTSGSMEARNKLPLLKQSFSLMLSELRPEDSIAIVTYAGSAGRVLDPTPASDHATILAALDRLSAGGSTAGQAGLQQAYATADEMQKDGEISRVILATDGDFNVGLSDPDALKDYIADKRTTGTYLSVLGFGRGNLDDATMQALAQSGNGQAAYIDTLHEARKVLVDQLTGTLFPIADDVKIQVEFNPAAIAEYRLIGYETRQLNREDFNNDKVDAGEIGAGHSVTALYELTPVGSPARKTDPLRYGVQPEDAGTSELGFLKLRYKAPGTTQSQLVETPILPDAPADDDLRFAAAIAGFGQLLTDTRYLGDWGWDDAIALATENRGPDPFGYRSEAVSLMRLGQSLAARP